MTQASHKSHSRPDDAAIVFSGLLPHPPIVVPAVGGSRTSQCRATLDACRELARRFVARAPARLILPSPHAPRQRQAFGLRGGVRITGDLSRFGAPSASVDLPNDPDLVADLRGAMKSAGLATWDTPETEPLDHGASVPLWFLAEAGWNGPTTVVGLPWSREPEVYEAFGRAAAQAADSVGGRTAFVASGDMSHRVLPGAPAGHHPRAVEFDHGLTDLLRTGRLAEIRDLDADLRELAAEDAADTAIMACAAVGYRNHGHEVLSYEHPFGVGYLVAVFFDAVFFDAVFFDRA